MYDEADQAQQALARMHLLDNGQQVAIDHALHVIDNGPDENHMTTIFMQADVGCRKTFHSNARLAVVRWQGHAASAVATSGILATLMKGGRTAHNRFELPVPCLDYSFCGFSNTRDSAKLLRKAKLIAWNEAPIY